MASASPPPSSAGPPSAPPPAAPRPDGGGDPILCTHCGRTARNGIACQGICVADSGY